MSEDLAGQDSTASRRSGRTALLTAAAVVGALLLVLGGILLTGTTLPVGERSALGNYLPFITTHEEAAEQLDEIYEPIDEARSAFRTAFCGDGGFEPLRDAAATAGTATRAGSVRLQEQKWPSDVRVTVDDLVLVFTEEVNFWRSMSRANDGPDLLGTLLDEDIEEVFDEEKVLAELLRQKLNLPDIGFEPLPESSRDRCGDEQPAEVEALEVEEPTEPETSSEGTATPDTGMRETAEREAAERAAAEREAAERAAARAAAEEAAKAPEEEEEEAQVEPSPAPVPTPMQEPEPAPAPSPTAAP